MENQRNMTDLPLEVLDRIFRYCGNTVNKVNLAQAHPYFVEAFVYHSRNAFKDIYYLTGISMSCWEYILPLCGSNVNLIKRSAYKTNDLSLDNLILQHCHNLKDISLSFDVEGLNYVSNFISDKKNSVKSLDLHFKGSRTSEDQIKLLEDLPDLPHLTKLRIKQTPSDDLHCIQKFINLTELDLEIVREFYPKVAPADPVDIFSICAPLKKLRLLKVKGIDIASDDPEVNPTLNSLEDLNIVHCDISMEFPVFPKLKVIQFNYIRTFTSASLVRKSIINQGETLERLLFLRGTTPYDGEGLLELVKGCRKLRYFLAPIHAVKFTLDLVTRLINDLKKNGYTTDDPLELVMDEYFKLKWLCHWLKFASSEKLIKPRLDEPVEYNLKNYPWY
ncbi:uncharacterized protein LOC108090547 [Drosophila ficusphila]|uniref:uncharacterized protein LOC108090547 n=1 Tax=Drosophila ficusphila TaxID=30025 RepID=UPI0007E8A140|nr:uncharacterized protein LOC108090547 [Drosophila ficusphila]